MNENDEIYNKYKKYFIFSNRLVETFYKQNKDIFISIGYDVEDLKSYVFIKIFESIKDYDKKITIERKVFTDLTIKTLKRLIKQNFRKLKNFNENDRKALKKVKATKKEKSELKKKKHRVFLGWVSLDSLTPESMSLKYEQETNSSLDSNFYESLEFVINNLKISDLDKRILELIVLNGYQPKEAAEKLKVSRQYIYQVLNNNKESLKKANEGG